MSNYQNIIDIYDRLVDVSNQLHETKDKDLKGFDKALFMLHHALKSFESINMHIENKRLTKALEKAELKLLRKEKLCPCKMQEQDIKNIKQTGYSNNSKTA